VTDEVQVLQLSSLQATHAVGSVDLAGAYKPEEQGKHEVPDK